MGCCDSGSKSELSNLPLHFKIQPWSNNFSFVAKSSYFMSLFSSSWEDFIHIRSASAISLPHSIPTLHSVPFLVDCKLKRKCFTHEVTLNNLPSQLNVLISTTFKIPNLFVMPAMVTVTFFSSSMLCGVLQITGHPSFGPDNQAGPLHHN